jgi:hypothetical protein
LDTKISEESVFKLVQQKNYGISISMTKILHAVKGGQQSSYCSFGVKQQSLTSLLIYQTLFLVVFEYFYDAYLFEINSLAIRRTVT